MVVSRRIAECNNGFRNIKKPKQRGNLLGLFEGSLLRVSEIPAERFDLGWLRIIKKRQVSTRNLPFFIQAEGLGM